MNLPVVLIDQSAIHQIKDIAMKLFEEKKSVHDMTPVYLEALQKYLLWHGIEPQFEVRAHE